MSDALPHVCFVCSGNICRSPMAAMVFREQLHRAGLAGSVRVSSAGTGPWHIGEPADPRARETLTEHGYPTDHVAAQLGAEHLDADLLLAADSGHLAALRRAAGPDDDRVHLLREFDPTAEPGAEIPDPYYGGAHGFDTVLTMIERTMPSLLAWARARVPQAS